VVVVVVVVVIIAAVVVFVLDIVLVVVAIAMVVAAGPDAERWTGIGGNFLFTVLGELSKRDCRELDGVRKKSAMGVCPLE
jgi:hypothetical protein